jgi:hypothetical protein
MHLGVDVHGQIAFVSSSCFQIPQEYDIEIVDALDHRIVYRGQDGEIFRHLERSHAIAITVYEPIDARGGFTMESPSGLDFGDAEEEEPELKRLSLVEKIENQLRELGIGITRANGERWSAAAVKRVSSPEAALEWIMSELERDS